MKRFIALTLVLLSAGAAMPISHAGDLTEASGVAAAGGLSMVAAPLLLVGGTAAVASGAGVGIIKLVGNGGESMTELTLDALRYVDKATITEVTCRKPCYVDVTINNTKKEIPLVVRKEYVQMNLKVN